MPSGTGFIAFRESPSDALFRRRDCRRTRRAFSPVACDAGIDAVSHDLLPHFSNALTTWPFTTMAIQKLKRPALHGPRRLSGDERTDASRLVRHRLFAAHSELGAHAAEERRRVRRYCFGRWRINKFGSDCGSLSARFRHWRANQTGTKTLEIGKAEVVKHGRECRDLRTRQHVRSRGRSTKKLEEKRNFSGAG